MLIYQDDTEDVKAPENVTHLNLMDQGLYNGVITYSSIREGYIMKYSMPLHDHQEGQLKEGGQLSQEDVDNAEEIEKKPLNLMRWQIL